jgi:hypothetical protein
MGAALIAAIGLSGCESGCNEETIERAQRFLESHQSCEVDADCVVVSDFCEELPGGFCGQLTMNRTGERSGEWRDLEEELRDCAPSKCTECLALLVPRCANGSCSGP